MEYENKENIKEAINKIILAPVSDTHIEFCIKTAEKSLGIKKIDLKRKFEPRKFSAGEYCPRFIMKARTLHKRTD